MRYINNSVISCPSDWEGKSASAKASVVSGGSKAGDHSEVWKCLKDSLADLSADKCWYCEVKQIRSDNAVDHFRPKDLYKWLAFDRNNFRYACTYCNSLRTNPETGKVEGKGNKFPLFDEAKRATCEGEEVREAPLLIDPCKIHEPTLLDFYEDGTPLAKFKDDANKKLRADTSIALYHLDHPDLVEARRRLANDLSEAINSADQAFARSSAGDSSYDSLFEQCIKKIASAMHYQAELSVFSRLIVLGHRDKIWVQQLLAVAA